MMKRRPRSRVKKGAGVMTGREPAIYQAAEAFELSTGLAP